MLSVETRKLLKRIALIGLAILSAPSQAESNPPMLRAADALWLPGVNIAGGEFNARGTKLGTDYRYPSTDRIDYFAAKGFRVFRVPFRAKRVVRPATTGGILLTTDVDVLIDVIDHAAKRNAYVILDMHDYGRFFSAGLIGRDPDATEEFAAAWGMIAARVKERANVVFGLMNEPNKQTAKEWLEGANAAIAAIRDAGANQMILVPGSYWSGAHSWLRRDNATVMLGVIDPANNFAYEVHQYLDKRSSGTKPDVVEGAGSSRLNAFTAWAKEHKVRAFLGEFGWAQNDQAHAEGEALLAHMSNNRDVWIGWAYWAAGPWRRDYMFSLEPLDGIDRPQMSVLEKFIE